MAIGDEDICPYHDKRLVAVFCQTCEEMVCTMCISQGKLDFEFSGFPTALKIMEKALGTLKPKLKPTGQIIVPGSFDDYFLWSLNIYILPSVEACPNMTGFCSNLFIYSFIITFFLLQGPMEVPGIEIMFTLT